MDLIIGINYQRYIFPFLLILMVMGVICFSLYMVFGGGNRLKHKLRDNSRRFLLERKSTLLPWNPTQALPDISSLCIRKGASSVLDGGWTHCHGTVLSNNNQKDTWLAFAVNTHMQVGSVVVHTSSNILEVNVSRGSLPHGMRKAEFLVDNRALGSMNIETRELYDKMGQPLGRIKGGRTIIIQGTTNYATVEIHGKNIAQINTEIYRWGERLAPMTSAFRIYDGHLSVEEQWWLVALFAIGLFRDCLYLLV